ncbi:hypothetical protein KIV56_17265 [Cryobacterium breve]|uniref:Apea-like HEPN domain-containing protein n=1 Tax=Cryobacterium breve TaxID=1259258 RepID=A0ABY7NBL2_9MICO|nr:hypothetical protein [Cryobacterium breve]WBM79893.1 hypothetical protein KIV56_17265 [Cryobacterium breve]
MSFLTTEFTDTYSDDMIFLETVRRSVLRNPFENHVPDILDATVARIYAVMMIGNVENAIAEEFQRTGNPDLNIYLHPRTKNPEKIAALRNYFQSVYTDGVSDSDVLSDYLAIKYLRNGIIHSDRRVGNQAQFVTERGFPVDSRDLRLSHLDTMGVVNTSMIAYLGLPRLLGKSDLLRGAVERVSGPSNYHVDAPYTLFEFLRLHSRNLNNVGSSWSRLLEQHPSEARQPIATCIEVVEKIRAADLGGQEYAQVLSWSEAAAYSWREVTRLLPDPAGRRLVNDARYRGQLLRIALSLAHDGGFPRAQLGAKVYRRLIDLVESGKLGSEFEGAGLFEDSSLYSAEDVLECYAIGEVAYDLTAGLPLRWVWVVLACDTSDAASELASTFIDLAELGRAWYMAIEHSRPHLSEDFEQYRSAISKLKQ